ncbi:hypothetical protein BC827DRAFT_501044 [Russula dissimulans]|nr:hypothetical protein BC827DRAFT_501044 [Russula dissimulans]
MRLYVNTLITFLHSIGGRKVQFNFRRTKLPNIFQCRNPRVAARSASLRAARSMGKGRIRNTPTRNSIPRSTEAKPKAANPHGHGTDRTSKRQQMQPPLTRSNTVLLPPPTTHPQPPGAFEPSFAVPGFPLMDDKHLPALVRRKIFVDALREGREALRECTRERRSRAAKEARARRRAEPPKTKTRRRAESKKRRYAAAAAADAEFARLLEKDLKKARAAHDRAEYLRLVEQDLKNARAAHRRAEDEEFARLLAEDLRRAREAQRRAEEAARKEKERERRRQEEERRKKAVEEEEERRRKAEEEERRREAAEEELRRRRAKHERAHRKQRRERPSFLQGTPPPLAGAEAAYAQALLGAQLRTYQEKWAVLRNSTIAVRPLRFCDIPWPSFGNVLGVEDITVERVQEFVCHPLYASVQGSPRGQGAKAIRSEMLRWHPDKFPKVLERVVEGDREVVREAAENVARILNQLTEEVR